MTDPLVEFERVLTAAGLSPGPIHADGALHRCPTADKPRGQDGSYKLHLDPPASGWFKNWRTGEENTWTHKNGRSLSGKEREGLKARIEADKKAKQDDEARRYAEGASKARRILEQGKLCPPSHPYFVKKGLVPPESIRVDSEGRALVPVLAEDGAPMSLQYITEEGKKRFLPGGRVAGGFFPFAGSSKDGPLLIAEGVATASSIKTAMDDESTVLAAFSAGSLRAVAEMARRRYPERRIVICADNDLATDGNPGLTNATDAARAVGGYLAWPEMDGEKCDFNDLHLAQGVKAVRERIEAATRPDQGEAEKVEVAGPVTPVWFEDCSVRPIAPELAPGLLGEFCRALAEAVQVPFELPFAATLGTIATAVQRKIRVRVKHDHFEGLNLYALCPLPPGERKSAVVAVCKKPLVQWQADARREMERAINDASSERKTLERVIEAKRKKAGTAKDDETRRALIEEIKRLESELPDIPVTPRLLVDDFTAESLAERMSQHDERLGMIEAEGGIFDTLSGRYSSGVPNLDLVLKAWCGESATVDRKGREPVLLVDPHFTMCICPQPTVIQGLASQPGFRGRGLVGRFLYFMPKSRLGSRAVEAPPMPERLNLQYNELIQRLLSIPWATDEDGRNTAHVIRLDPGALAHWLAFSALVEKGLGPGGELAHMTDWGGKFPGQVARLAGLLHCAVVPRPHETDISEETMMRALEIGAILSEHAKAAYGLMGSDPSQECARHVLDWLTRDRVELFTARDAFERVKGRFKTMAEVKPGLATLEERFFILPRAEERTGRGRPSQLFEVNPLTFEPQKRV